MAPRSQSGVLPTRSGVTVDGPGTMFVAGAWPTQMEKVGADAFRAKLGHRPSRAGNRWGTASLGSRSIFVPAPAPGAFPGEERVINSNCPDPSVTPDAGGYWLVCTDEFTRNLPLYHSTGLEHWTLVSTSLLRGVAFPRWAASQLWGPTLAHLPGGWRLYVSARGPTGQRHILVASAPAPIGPWTVKRLPVVSDPEGVIDPSYFVDGDGRQYLLWKVDGNAYGKPAKIRMQQLDDSGIALVGRRDRLLITNDRRWEGNVVEAPVLIWRNGWYYLFYSANVYTTPNYAVGVARARSLGGPWRKHRGSILRSASPWWAPGGQTLTTDASGETVMLWHADWGPRFAGLRRVLAGGVVWNRDGWPRLLVGPDTPAPASAKRR